MQMNDPGISPEKFLEMAEKYEKSANSMRWKDDARGLMAVAAVLARRSAFEVVESAAWVADLTKPK